MVLNATGVIYQITFIKHIWWKTLSFLIVTRKRNSSFFYFYGCMILLRDNRINQLNVSFTIKHLAKFTGKKGVLTIYFN
jgi:hypothetical protein